jgi:hypothetical protein
MHEYDELTEIKQGSTQRFHKGSRKTIMTARGKRKAKIKQQADVYLHQTQRVQQTGVARIVAPMKQ